MRVGTSPPTVGDGKPALADITQHFGQLGVCLCHLICWLWETKRRGEEERSQGSADGGGVKVSAVRGLVLPGGVWVQTCSCEYSKGVRNKNKRAFKAGRAWRGSRMSERGHKRGLSGGGGLGSCFSVSNGTKNMLPGCCRHRHFTHASEFPLRSKEFSFCAIICWPHPLSEYAATLAATLVGGGQQYTFCFINSKGRI